MFANKRNIALAALLFLALGSAAFVARMFLLRMDADGKKPPTPTTDEDPLDRHGTRQAFARAMSKIEVGMAAKDVLELLGKPNDVRTENDPGGALGIEIWAYGTDGHLTFPTLGRVYINHEHKVQDVYGGRGEAPDREILPEAELRLLLRLIDEVPSYQSQYDYNPLAVIRVVNALQPLGKDNALGVIDEYLRVAVRWNDPACEGVFLVLRVLFDVPADPGYMPPMYVGASEPEAPKDPKRLPRFPILLQDDVPLLLIWGYTSDGAGRGAESHVEYFRDKGRLREKPLAPCNDPLGLLDAWAKNASWLYEGEGPMNSKLLIANQLLNLIDSVYHLDKDDNDVKFYPADDIDGHWQAIKDEVAKLNLRWSAEKNRYIFQDGSHLPEPPRLIFRRHIWQPKELNGDVALIIERMDMKKVSILLERWRTTQAFVLYIFDVNDKATTLVEMRAIGGGGFGENRRLQLAEGAEVQARLQIGKREELSPVYKP